MAFSWLVRLLTLAVWVLAAGSATWWGMKHLQTGNGAAATATVAPALAQASPADLQRVLGRNPVAAAGNVVVQPRPVDPATRFALHGVVAGRGNSGVALLSIEGKAARPYRVGSEVEDGLKLVKVAAREATLEGTRGGPSFTLELPRAGRTSGDGRAAPALAASSARPAS